MSVSEQWLEELEARFGVTRAVSAHLRPLFDRLAAQALTPEEREHLLHEVALALRRTSEPRIEPVGGAEFFGLLGQFTSELQKMDETLKVLRVYLERLNQKLVRPEDLRVLH